jgi:eukaryotic-like serine/threonine-protein kinase
MQVNVMNRDSIQDIGQYQILEIIGQGGMGTVYKALDTRSNQTVALKLMHKHLADKPDFQARFLSECRASAALSHQHIVRIFDVALLDGQLYMVMEYIDGGTLRKLLNAQLSKNCFLDLREIVTITRQVAQALHYAHTQGIIHRDVKPDNVLLRAISSDCTSPEGIHALLTDFGLAKRVQGGASITTSGELLGTLAYMAPEQFRDIPLDGRTDIYALGVMLYELVSGRQPFISTNAMDIILMHTQGEPERIQDLRPDTPPALVSILHRAMLKNPDDRYETAGELARELEALEKTIKPITESRTWRTKPITVNENGPATVFDILPSLDSPAVPVDLLSEGADDVIIVTPNEGPSWSLPFEKPSIIVGRDPGCDLRLDDARVSRQHIRVDRLPDGQMAVTDLGSMNGVFMGDDKIEKNTMKAWLAAQSIKVGPFWLTLRLAKTPIGQGRRLALTAPRPLETRFDDRSAILRLTPGESVIEPGSSTVIRVEITNNTDNAQYYVLNLQGVPPEWFTLAPLPLHVPPHKTAERLIKFHPPRSASSAATNYDYMLSVTQQNDARTLASLIGTLRVFPFYAFTSEITSANSRAQVCITNQGNSQRFYVVEVRERQNTLIMLPSRARVLIPPGQDRTVDIRVLPKRRPIFGMTHRYPVEIFIRTDGLRPQTQFLDFPVRPVVPWEIIALLLFMAAGFGVALLTLWRG